MLEKVNKKPKRYADLITYEKETFQQLRNKLTKLNTSIPDASN